MEHKLFFLLGKCKVYVDVFGSGTGLMRRGTFLGHTTTLKYSTGYLTKTNETWPS